MIRQISRRTNLQNADKQWIDFFKFKYKQQQGIQKDRVPIENQPKQFTQHSQLQKMQNQHIEHANYISENNGQQSNSINKDLIKLRQMNQAFSKMNEHHMYSGHEYYTYQPQPIEQMQSFNARQVYSVHQSLQQRQSEDITERSNSLLFTLSEKDEEQTRPTTNVQHLQYEYDSNGNIYQQEQTSHINDHRFGSYHYNNSQDMTVNNTLQNNVFYQKDPSDRAIYQKGPIERLNQEINAYPQTQQQMHYDSNNMAHNYQAQQYQEQYSHRYQQQYNNNYDHQPNHYNNQLNHYNNEANHYNNQHNQYVNRPQQQVNGSNGFSKYQQFAIKISKLFNIHVEDLELIYNQLKSQKQTQLHQQAQYPQQTQLHQQTQLYQQTQYHQKANPNKINSQLPSNPIQISDSQVMKKLFSYALEIKNSHNKLKNMITSIDHRNTHQLSYNQSQTKNHNKHRQRPQTHIPSKNQLENISINFMLEQQHHQINQSNQSNQSHNQNNAQTQRISLNKHHNHEQNRDIQSKKTIIDQLVSHKDNLNSQLQSQQTILSHSSYADSNITNTNKCKKKNRVTEKIKLISQQLESLKKQIDQQEDTEPNLNQKISISQQQDAELNLNQKQEHQSQHQNISRFYTAKQSRSLQQRTQNTTNGPIFSFQRESNPHQYLPSMTRQISQYVIKVNQSQTKPIIANPQNTQTHKESEPHIFGGESFTYIKSIQQLPMEDPEIDLKIQQTIKTCIVKSPSKKLINQPTHHQITQTTQPPQPIAPLSQSKRSQKLIVEQALTSNSRSKYSFRQNSELSSKENSETMITSPTKSQSRQKIFKSIAQMRRNNHSKDKLSLELQQSQWSKSKTTNNAYLDDEKNTENKSRESLFTKNVFQASGPINYEKISGAFSKPKFYTKQVMRDGKLVFQKSQMTETQHNIRQPNDERKETATFGALSPSQTDKFIKSNQNNHHNPIYQTNISSSNIHSSHSPMAYHSNISQPNTVPINFQPISNTQIEASEGNRKTFSMGGPSSLYQARTIESRPFIESQNHLSRHGLKGPVYVMHPQNNFGSKQKYEYVPKMISVKQSPSNNPSTILFAQPTQTHITQRNVSVDPKLYEVVRPVTPQKQYQVVRPVTPINKIQNINIQVNNNKKPRSFSVQRIKGPHNVQNANGSQNVQFQQNYLRQNQIIPNSPSQIRMVVSPSKVQHNVISRPSVMNTPVSVSKIVQRPFSVPIRSMTPERTIQANFRQTLIEKPKVIHSNFTQANNQNEVKRQEMQKLLMVKQFELKPHSQSQVQMRPHLQQENKFKPNEVTYNYHQSRPAIQQNRILETSKKEGKPILNEFKNSQTPAQTQLKQIPLNGSKQTTPIIQNFPSLNIQKRQSSVTDLTPKYSQVQLQNPRLQQSQMYYGQLKASVRTPVTQMPTNYKQMNLMSSRRTDSVVHTFPVHMENSSKMNNSIYTKEEIVGRHHTERVNNTSTTKPIYGEIITYQPATSQKNPFSQQPTRIPTSFRPPKYIPPKQQIQTQQSKHTNHQIPTNQNNSSSKPNQYPPTVQDSSRPPIKTYTMGHLLQASKTQKYMQQSIMDDRKSNTALNASNANVRMNDLHDSTPSFGRYQQDSGAQSMVISPFSKELSNLNQSRNSSASKRSSSSRSKSNKKGIALESKRSRSPSHKFYQSSYNH